MKAAHHEGVLEGMRTTLITLSAALVFAGMSLASALPAAAAQPPCLSGDAVNFGGSSRAKEIYVRSCRAPSPGGKMREYGFIRIGPSATTATDCVLKIRTGVKRGNNVSFETPTWGSCRSALRTGRDFIAYGRAVPTRADHLPQFTEFCYELRKGGRRMSGHCVRSQLV
jgi:hypothetical protein